MSDSESVAVIGLGEIGKPLLELIAAKYKTKGIDIGTKVGERSFDFLHICYPYHGDDFVAATVEYICRFRPSLVVINSTLALGTTRKIHAATQVPIVHSPVRGKHVKMQQDMLRYIKFIGGVDEASSRMAAEHFKRIGIKTKILKSPEASELAKLSETTYFGLLIAWAQEVERYCNAAGADYGEVVSIFEEINYLPGVRYFPGVIGGHCVMANIALLKRDFSSDILDAIEQSNVLKKNLEMTGLVADESAPEHTARKGRSVIVGDQAK